MRSFSNKEDIGGEIMSLQIISGKTGSGKTYYCSNQIIKQSDKDKSENYILLVPEQFTLQTQKDMVIQHPQEGILSIEVLSFERLAFKLFDEVGGISKKILEDTGKSLVVRKVLGEQKKELKLFSKNIDKVGLVDDIKSIITEFLQYNIRSNQIKDLRNTYKESPLLQAKIEDLINIYNAFEEFIEENYITNEEVLDELSEVIFKSEYIKKCNIWIDSFTGFTPIQYKVLEQLMIHAKNVKITLTLDTHKIKEKENKYQLFYESKKTYNKLIDIAKENNIKIDKDIWLGNNIPIRLKGNKEIAHLEKNIFRYKYEIYNQDLEHINIHIADHMSNEINYVGRKIIHLVREYGYRYKEIAVVTGDIGRYSMFIDKIFADYNLPIFIDQKKTIIANPLIEFVRATLDIFNNYWTHDSIIRLLRTDLMGLSREETDIVDNYSLAYGIRGMKKWCNEWEKPYPKQIEEENNSISIEYLNELREKVVNSLEGLYNGIKGTNKVEIITEKIYLFLEELKIEEKIIMLADDFKEKGELILEREFRQIFGLLVELFDKTVEILGNEEIKLKEYAKILDAGLEQSSMGLVPPGLDQIVIGDIERTRLKDIKVLFLIGCNEGVIPKIETDTGILSDKDREQFQEKGIVLAPTSKEKSFEDQFNIYMNLTKPSDRLYFSLSKLDADFKNIRPSTLINQVLKIYPKLRIGYDDNINEKELITLPDSTLKYLVDNLRDIKVKPLSNTWKEVYGWYYKNEPWNKKIIKIVEGLFYENQEEYLSEETVKKLYGKYLVNSVSRIEQFAKCPFSHFAKYGLKINERMIYELTVPDIGILFHNAIEHFSKKLKANNLEWNGLDKELRVKLVEESVRDVAEQYGHHIFFSSSKNEYLIQRVIRITNRTIWALQKHIESGAFKPSEYEVGFNSSDEDLKSLKIEFSNDQVLQLTGKIDRLDKYQDEDNIYLKIIDYKSGKQSFDLVALYYGLQLQLFVYLNAAMELEKKGEGTKTNKAVVPAGAFYYHIDDPIITTEKQLTEKEMEELILNQLKMDGLVLDDIEVIKLLDKNMSTQSNIIPVKLKKDGSPSKSSSVANKENFEKLSKFVDNKVKDFGSEIINGNIEIAPYELNDKKACDYCSYSSVCQFDNNLEDNNYKKLVNLKKEDAWKYITS